MAETANEAPSKPLLEEVASTGDGVLKGLGFDLHGGLARARDLRLHALGGEAYRLMLRDDQVASTFQQRRLAVIARDWSVTPGGDAPEDEAAADHLSAQLDRVGFDRVTEKMLYGVFYGYAVAEILWKVENGRVEIDTIKVRDRNRFRFDADRRLKLLTTMRPDGEVMPPAKFWCFTAGGDHDDDPYGVGLGYHLYWPVWFKREGLKSWLQGLDKTARPTAVGKFPAGASQDDIDRLLDTLAAYASDTGIAIPDAMSIELLQAARSATSDYDTLYNRMDAAISKIVLSQTMTTDSSVSGLGSNQADVHRDVKQEVVKADADLLNESFNATVAKWLTGWNFPGAKPPRVSRQIDDAEDLDAASARDVRLSQIGWRPTEERVRETYGEGYERADAAPSDPVEKINTPPPAFAEQPQVSRVTAEHALATGLLEDRWEEIMNPLLKPVRALLERVRSYREAASGLSDTLSDMDESAARELLARAGFQLRIAANVGAIDEDDVEAADLSESDGLKKKLLNPHRDGCAAAQTADFEDFELKPLPPAEAIRFFERKGYRIGFDFRDVWQEEHARSFTVAKAMRLELLELIRAEVAKGLEDGTPFETFRKNLTPILQREGWWGRKEVVDPLTGETVLAQLGSPRRLRIIFDTNLRTARAAGRWERIERNKARRPFLRYSQIQRPTRRDEHERWHGLIRPVDDPVWDKIYPPNGFNCFPAETIVRCDAKIGLKAFYAGEMVELRSARGHRLTVTANHPILTRRGWVAAHQIEEGDQLIGASGGVDAPVRGIVNDQNAPASAEYLFEALASKGLRVVPMTPNDFDGDALAMKGEIHVAGSDRALMNIIESACGQFVGEGPFEWALHRRIEAADVASGASQTAAVFDDAVFSEHPSDSGFGEPHTSGDFGLASEVGSIQGEDAPLDLGIASVSRSPSGGALALDAADRRFDFAPFNASGSARSSQFDADALHGAAERAPTAAGLFRELLEANPGAIAFDQVVEIRKFQWTGHVFDFSTSTGLILADGIVVSNCGCSIQQLTEAEAKRRGITPPGKAAAILRSTRRFINKRTGEISSVTRGVDPSFDYNVGKAHMRGAEQALVSALAAGDAAAAQRTLEEAVAGEGFSDFLRSPDRHGFHPVMLIDEEIGRRIGAKTRVVRISAETMHKQDREHPDLTEAHYRALPLIGADPDLVIQQNDKTLYMIRQGDHWLVAVVKATQTGKAAFVTSFRGTNRLDVGNLTRRGRVIFRKKE